MYIMDVKKLSLMSYNVSYQATYGVIHRSVNVACPFTDGNKTYDVTICVHRIANIIDSLGPFDFVTLIEASMWQKIKNLSSTLGKMDQIHHKSGKDCAVLFYNREFTLSSHIGCDFEWGRPILLAFFTQLNTCVISIHAGHGGSVLKLTDILTKVTLNASKKQRDILLNGHVIVIGDFNYSFPGTTYSLDLLSVTRTLYGINKTPSCCMGDLGLNNDAIPQTVSMNYDQILSTNDNIKTEIVGKQHKLSFSIDKINSTKLDYPTYTSDHLPIIGTVTLDNTSHYEKKLQKYKSKYEKLKSYQHN